MHIPTGSQIKVLILVATKHLELEESLQTVEHSQYFFLYNTFTITFYFIVLFIINFFKKVMLLLTLSLISLLKAQQQQPSNTLLETMHLKGRIIISKNRTRKRIAAVLEKTQQ